MSFLNCLGLDCNVKFSTQENKYIVFILEKMIKTEFKEFDSDLIYTVLTYELDYFLFMKILHRNYKNLKEIILNNSTLIYDYYELNKTKIDHNYKPYFENIIRRLEYFYSNQIDTYIKNFNNIFYDYEDIVYYVFYRELVIDTSSTYIDTITEHIKNNNEYFKKIDKNNKIFITQELLSIFIVNELCKKYNFKISNYAHNHTDKVITYINDHIPNYNFYDIVRHMKQKCFPDLLCNVINSL